MQPPVPAQPVENPYAPPKADTGAAGSGGGDLTDEEIDAFVGEGGDYYRKAWATANRTGRFYAGFNLAALIVSSLWLLYRKMYLAAVVLMVVQAGVMFLSAFVAFTSGLEGPEVLMAVFACLLVTKVVIAFLGNGLYLRRARRGGAAGGPAAPGPGETPYPGSQGGTSLPAVVVGILANAVLSILSR